MGIVVIGDVFIDVKGYSTAPFIPGGRNAGVIQQIHGGVGRNVAVSYTHLDVYKRQGGSYVDKTMYCAQISDLISAFIIYLCGFVFFFKLWLNRYLDKRDEKKAAKGGEK